MFGDQTSVQGPLATLVQINLEVEKKYEWHTRLLGKGVHSDISGYRRVKPCCVAGIWQWVAAHSAGLTIYSRAQTFLLCNHPQPLYVVV